MTTTTFTTPRGAQIEISSDWKSGTVNGSTCFTILGEVRKPVLGFKISLNGKDAFIEAPQEIMDEYSLFTSPSPEVVEQWKIEAEAQRRLLNAMRD